MGRDGMGWDGMGWDGVRWGRWDTGWDGTRDGIRHGMGWEGWDGMAGQFALTICSCVSGVSWLGRDVCTCSIALFLFSTPSASSPSEESSLAEESGTALALPFPATSSSDDSACLSAFALPRFCFFALFGFLKGESSRLKSSRAFLMNAPRSFGSSS